MGTKLLMESDIIPKIMVAHKNAHPMHATVFETHSPTLTKTMALLVHRAMNIFLSEVVNPPKHTYTLAHAGS